jgi:hypothetical protein
MERVERARSVMDSVDVVPFGATVAVALKGELWLWLPTGDYPVGATVEEMRFVQERRLDVALRARRRVHLDSTLVRAKPLVLGESNVDPDRPRAEDGCDACEGHAYVLHDELDGVADALAGRDEWISSIEEWSALMLLLNRIAPYIAEGFVPNALNLEQSCGCACDAVSGLGARHVVVETSRYSAAGGPCHVWPFQSDSDQGSLLASAVAVLDESELQGVVRPARRW